LQGKRTEQQITQKKPNTKENNIKTIPDLLWTGIFVLLERII
jgi:hypothetical protein